MVPGSKFLRKLFVSGLLLSVIPVAALGLFSYIRSSEAVQEKLKEANLQILYQNQQRVEQNVQTIQHSITQFANTDTAAAAVDLMITPQDFKLFFQYYNELKKLQTIDLPLGDVELVNLDKGWLINNDGLKPVSSGEKETYARLKSGWGSYNDSNNGRGILYVKKLPAEFVPRYALLIAKIPEKAMNRLLSSENADLGNVYVLDPGFRVMAANNSTETGSDLSGQPFVHEASHSTVSKGTLISGPGSDPSMITFRKSDSSGWLYLSQTPLASVNRDSGAIGRMTVYLCVLILIFTVLVNVLLSRNLYRPVRNLYRKLTSMEPSRRKNADEFEEISLRFHNLIENELIWTERYRNQLPLLRELFMNQLYDGKLTPSEIASKWALYGLPPKPPSILLLAVEIDSLEGTRFHPEDLDLLLFAAGNIAGDIVPAAQNINIVTKHQTVLIMATYDPEPVSVNPLAEQIRNEIGRYLNVSVSIGLSQPFERLEYAHGAYIQCTAALKARLLNGCGSIVITGAGEATEALRLSYSDKHQRALIESVQLADEKAAAGHLSAFLKETSEQSDVQAMQTALAGLLSELLKSTMLKGERIPSMNRQDKTVFEQLLALKTLQEAETWFAGQIIVPLVTLVKERHRLQRQTITERMLEIIHADFDKHITLDTCAALLHYHPNHLKRVFRQEAGVSFSDYLASYRLKTAKVWLVQADMSVSAVAERLCFSNVQNFSRYFRKMEGISPSGYKERYSNNSSAP